MKRDMLLPGMLLFLCLLALFPACTTEEPPVVWDPNAAGSGTPQVTGVSPSSALGGITEVRISGKNFSPVDSNNSV